MQWSFRSLLIALALALCLASTGGLATFFLSLYQKDKVGSIWESDLATTRSIATHLRSLTNLANLIELDRVESSSEIMFLFEDPCDVVHPVQSRVSKKFASQFAELDLRPSQWNESIETKQACDQMNLTAGVAGAAPTQMRAVNSDVQLKTPYVLLLLRSGTRNRLAMISMDGFRTSQANTLFISDAKANLIWAADGIDYLRSALTDTRVGSREILRVADQAIGRNLSSVGWSGSEGLLSYAPINEQWAMMSLSYRPEVERPVVFVLEQVIALAIGIFFLCSLVGKKGAERLAAPLLELGETAKLIGSGDFKAKLAITGPEEFASVRRAINTMGDQIQSLMVETHRKAELEGELELAQQVQKLLIPPPLMEACRHRIHSFSIPAEHVGGDWWGYLEIPVPGRQPVLLLMVGDVTDHGAPSALVAATVRGAVSMLGNWVAQNPSVAGDPRRVLRYLNKTVFEAAQSSLTMTFIACVLDLERETVTLANAGHVLPYIVGGEGAKRIGRSGQTLGSKVEGEFDEIETHPWKVGDKLFLYSDGLIECYQDGKNLFERKHLVKFLKGESRKSGKEIMGKLMKHRQKLINGLPEADDVTAVLCEALPGGSGGR